jgi:hypothetical protein
MNTRCPGDRWGNIKHTITSLFIGVSLIISGCSHTPPQAVITPNQTIPNATIPQPSPVPNATLNNSTTTPPAGNTTITPIPAPNITPTPPPAPNITANTTPPLPPVPAPNTTQNITPLPPPVPTENATPNTTSNATPNETQVLVSYSKKIQIYFNAFCIGCHTKTDNTTILKLDPGESYKMLVGVPSKEKPDILRVKPGAPDESYILTKIAQDPQQHATPPQQQYIDVIRQWILEGALNN